MSKITQIQTILGVPADDEWGPLSQNALAAEIRRSHEVIPAPPKPPPFTGQVHPFVAVAREWMGRPETSANHFQGMEKVWADTNYPNGYQDRAPYCAAFQCYVVAEARRRGANIKERPTSPSVSEFRNWCRARGYAVSKPQPGDFGTLLPSGTSHIFLVESPDGSVVHTLEGNTDGAGSREGDGFWEKTRRIASCDFFRIPILP